MRRNAAASWRSSVFTTQVSERSALRIAPSCRRARKPQAPEAYERRLSSAGTGRSRPARPCKITRRATAAPPLCAPMRAVERERNLAIDARAQNSLGTRIAAQCPCVLRQPVCDIGSQPANPAAPKSALPGESADHHHAQQQPSRSASESRNIVRAQDLLPVGERLVNPSRKANVSGGGGDYGRTWSKRCLV
jgi:hypothetical protein